MSDPSRLAAALADRYRIDRELGAGGMATVYLAQDLKHAKALLPTLGADALLPAKHAMNLNPDLAQWTELVGRSIFANGRNEPGARAQGIGGAGQSLELRGRFRDSWVLVLKTQAIIDSIRINEEWGFWRDFAPAIYRLEGLPVYAGWDARPAPPLLRLDDWFNSDPGRAFNLGQWGISRNQPKLVTQVVLAFRRQAAELDKYLVDTATVSRAEIALVSTWQAVFVQVAQLLESWSAWASHPTDESLRRFAEATDSLRQLSAMYVATPDFILGKAYLAQGDLVEAKRHMLVPQRWSSGFFTELIVPREYYLGRIAEAEGDRIAAREHYERFVRWWRDCDPELKPMWEDGRQRLATVSGEPQEQ